MPTQDSLEISSRHFMYCKIKEWETIDSKSYKDIINILISNSKKYQYNSNMKLWCDFFEK